MSAVICKPRATARILSPALTALLKSVSRSFYLTLRILPAAIRAQIGIAYLLARASDTIADTDLLPLAQRLDALQELRQAILNSAQAPAFNAAHLSGSQSRPGERMLLQRLTEVLQALLLFTQQDQEGIRRVLGIIISGQELDLKHFAGASALEIVSLQTANDLDDYTYRVAGCVGEFWTGMCRRHLFPNAGLNQETLVNNGIRFGKGLQLVNILRDLPRDLQLGRCYLPAESLARAQLVPTDLRDPRNEERIRPVYDQYLDLAGEHLTAGWAYTETLPRSAIRLRLACAWPLLIGARTLARLREENVLDSAQRIKVSRAEIRGIILQSLLRYPWPGAWNKLFAESSRQSTPARSPFATFKAVAPRRDS